MKIPKVSVIIPTYNAEQFIEQTLDSVFNQSYQDFEVIIVDDGSSDGTSNIISRYRDRLDYIRKRNEGISVARNTGIARAKGEYIAFIDHDDIWLPEKLEQEIALLESNKEVALCFSDAYIIDEKGIRRHNLFNICSPHKGMVFKELLKENFIPVLTTVVKKEVFKEIGLFNPRYHISEDWDLFLRIARLYPVIFVNRPLAEYRIHAGSFSRQRNLLLGELISIIDEYISSVDSATARKVKMRKRKFQLDMGMVYMKRKMRSKARNYFLQRIQKDPSSFFLYLGLFMTYLPYRFVEFVGHVLSSEGAHGDAQLKPISNTGYLRPEKQMISKRILFEIGKIFKR